MGPQGSTKIPMWLDCDPGHDDTFAILLAAYHPDIELLGISTVFGNASLDKTTMNASSILTAIGKHKTIPLYPGASQAISRPPIHTPSEIHGDSGLDGTALLPPGLAPIQTSTTALEAMASALKAQPPNTAWVVATGACTNISTLFTSYPDLVGHVRGVSIMGGAIGGAFTNAVMGVKDGQERIGNWTQFAEFNILIDPEAAKHILATEGLREKVTMVPLDLTHLVLATKEVRQLLLWGTNGDEVKKGDEGEGKSKLRKMLVELLMFFAKTYGDVFGITSGPPLHDPLAVAAALPNEVLPFYDNDQRFAVTVVTEGKLEDALRENTELGRTIAQPVEPGKGGVRIPKGLDIPKFWRLLEECIERADEENERLETEAVRTV